MLRRVIKAFSVPVDNESTRGSVIYDHHCNESPWVSAQQIVLSCISMNMLTQVESITAMCYAEYQCITLNIILAMFHWYIHCNKQHPVVLHYDCTGVKIEVTVYVS